MELPGRPGLAAFCVAVWLAGCAPSPGSGQETEAPGVSDETLFALEGEEPANENLQAFVIPPDKLITAESVGLAQPGETLGALRDAIGDAPIRFVENYMVDLSAVCVDDADSGEELFCAAFAHTAQPSEDTQVEMISTRHPSFRTREGVGPGVKVSDAEVVYGDAFFVYNEDNESREYIEFDRGPAGSISFRPLAPANPNGFAGVYDDDDGGGFHETEDYDPSTVIGAVEVQAATR